MSRGAIYAGKAAILITIDDAVDKGLMLVKNKLRKFANGIGATGSSMLRGGVLGSIGSGFMVKQFADFSDELLNLQAKLGYFGKLTGQQRVDMDMLTKTIRHLGRTTSFTSKEVASAATELAQAGFSVTEINNSLQATLDLARGTNYGLADSAAMMANAIRTFNLDTKQANQVVSMFVRAARLGTLGIEDLREALKYVSGTAFNLEQTLPVVLGFLVQLSESGLKASLAGTSLNVAMLNLIKNLDKVKGHLPGFDLMFDNRGQLDFLSTMKELFAMTQGMSATQKTMLFGDVFNIRGARAVSSSQEIKQIEKFITSIATAGNEARLAAATMDSGIGGAIRRATSALDDLGKTIGNLTGVTFKGLLEAVAPVAMIFDRLAVSMPGIIIGLSAMPFALVAAGASFLALHVAIRRAADVLGVFLALWRKTSGGLTMLTARQMGAIGFGKSGGLLGKKGGIARTGRNLGNVFSGIGMIFSARKGIGTTASGAKIAVGLKRLGSGLLGLGKTMLSVMNIVRRFVFSWTGLFTVIELLLIFGHKIPIVVSAFTRLGNGVKGFFKEFGRIGGLLSGPMKLFGAAIGILSEGNGANSELGLQGTIAAVQMMADVVKGQLVAAWNQLVYAIAPVYDLFKKIFVTLYQIVGMTISMVSGVIGARFDDLLRIFNGVETGTDWNTFFMSFAIAIANFTKVLMDSLDSLANYFDHLIADAMYMLLELKSSIVGKTLAGYNNRRSEIGGVINQKDLDHALRQISRNKELKAVEKAIRAVFGTNTSEAAKRAYGQARAGSAAASGAALPWLDEMMKRNMLIMQQQAMANLPQNGAGAFGAGGARGKQAMQQQQQWINAIAMAVVGSAHATRGNLLQSTISTEDYLKKLNKLDSIDEHLDNIEDKVGNGFL